MAKEMQMNVIVVVLIVLPLKGITKEEVIEMEKLGIPSIIMSTKDDMLLPIKRLVFGTAEDFWMQNKIQNMLKNKDSLLHNNYCVTLV